MRFSALAVVLSYSTLTLAQTEALPKCAQSCIGNDWGGCEVLDVTCICSSKTLISNLACCVSTSCDAEDQETVIEFAQNLCTPKGVTDLPTTATCASGASATASGTSGTASGTAASASATTTGSAAASASSEISSAASAASSAASATAAGSSSTSTSGATTTNAAVLGRGTAGKLGMGVAAAGILAVL